MYDRQGLIPTLYGVYQSHNKHDSSSSMVKGYRGYSKEEKIQLLSKHLRKYITTLLTKIIKF